MGVNGIATSKVVPTASLTIEADEPRAAAEASGLVYVDEQGPGITRKRKGSAFAYYAPNGRLIRDTALLRRIRSLAVPPAYEDVWICPDPNGHIQATGRDERGRKQYRYHPNWRALRDETKYEHVVEFGKLLPRIRQRVAADMRRPGLPRRKVLATVVSLLEKTLIRIGNADYAKENKSYGLTTLRNRHVAVNGTELRFEFRGKSGKLWHLAVKDRRVARVVRACQDLPGQDLFQYLEADGSRQAVTSSDVNAYLREITGREITAKDFRTWAGTVLAAMALSEFANFDSAAAAKRNLKAAIERVAKRLGNTVTICRKCYVHPAILDAYLDGELLVNWQREAEGELRDELGSLGSEEAAVLAFLRRRLASETRRRQAADRTKARAAADRRRKNGGSELRRDLRRSLRQGSKEKGDGLPQSMRQDAPRLQ
ncbi:MAG: DNA topoisomerase IB [Hyphomicrobiales bacterium]|nr:DNA topoisomerase IB [Hyphomicrobiales bacterium]